MSALGGRTAMMKLGWSHIPVAVLFVATMATASHAQTFTSLVSFDGPDGANPRYGNLVQGRDANFYGTTSTGGNTSCSDGCGTVFKLTPNGGLTTLHSFNMTDGSAPWSGLLLHSDGDFYGTTSAGGDLTCVLSDDGCGTIFKVSSAGALTTIHNFTGTDGSSPTAGVIEGIDGSLYGTTNSGGDLTCGGGSGCGTIFKITPAGSLITLHSFNEGDGTQPIAGLIQATDGNFYGTTSGGGNLSCNAGFGCGTIFRITPSAKFKALHYFSGADGALPYGGLVQASDQNIYGTTGYGGSSNAGTIFKFTLSGKLTNLYTFCFCPDAAAPVSALVQGTDGNLYGTTVFHGNSWGTVFEITPGGMLTTLYSFCSQSGCADGAGPYGGLLLATNGTFYGTTYFAGGHSDGTVFNLSTGLEPSIAFVRRMGKVGQTGGILGQGFTGTTSVSFNSAPATFTVVSDTFIKATVPAGATTGYVTVATPSGTLTSNVPFKFCRKTNSRFLVATLLGMTTW